MENLALNIKKKFLVVNLMNHDSSLFFGFDSNFKVFLCENPPLVVTGWLTFGCGHGQRHAGGLEENSLPV